MAYLSYKMLAEYVILEKLKDEIEITDADKNAVAQFVQAHYLHKFPTGIKKIFAVNHKQQDGTKKMVGMVMYGSPFMTVSRFLEPAGIDLKETLELKRLFIDDVGIRNIESFVIGQTLGKIRKEMPEIRIVFTFADDKVGHVGSIYQATNAIYLGKSPDGKHKYIYIMNDKDKKAIEQIIKPQPYPKKEVPPTTEAIKPVKNQAQYDMLTQINRELEKSGKLQPAEIPEPPIDYPRAGASSLRYQDPLQPNKIPAILPSDSGDPGDDEVALNQKVIDAMKTMPYQDFEKDLFHPGGDDKSTGRIGKLGKYTIKTKKPRRSKSSLP